MMEHLQKKHKSQMSDDERVRDLQRKLYLKVKQEKKFRFYVLYDKVRTKYFLQEAYRRCKMNKGAPGVDGMTFSSIENSGRAKFLEEIRVELENREYKPSPVKRVFIPKANGKMHPRENKLPVGRFSSLGIWRPLGIPTIKDRVVQRVCPKEKTRRLGGLFSRGHVL